MTVDVVQFGFSFLIIVGIWLGYTRIIGILPVETPFTVLLPPANDAFEQAVTIDSLPFSTAADSRVESVVLTEAAI